ncbi:MAG TPA: ATP-binding protein [Candidatus Acidoferrales bacterium]|jgi:two-component system sensor histidine kinase HydH|nr:ATP-binding protein [Candidatus Acidoferrales bacterium]
MLDRKRSAVDWIDALWLLFIVGLAFLPPIDEVHKQLILIAFALFQFFEGKLVAKRPHEGPTISVGVKIVLATLLLDHTGEMGINSPYYPIYYLPIITAAIYYGPIGTLLWSSVASLAYCSFLISALEEYELTPEAEGLLALRILFFFLVAILVNRFVVENRRQVARYQALSQTLEETNRQLQRAEADARRSERLAALGQMSAGLAHEIRNPLGVIKGSAEMLVQKLKTAQPLESELAGYIFSEVNRLNALVARFLDFARPSNLELRSLQVASILDRALDSVQTQSPDAKVRVERHYTVGLPNILVDEQLCESVFVNLIHNAYQAMDAAPSDNHARERVLRLSIAPETSTGRTGVVVTVEDTGPGVPAELREQIFNPFYTSKKDGVGLGLAIVAKIVDTHRGWIRLDDNSPLGARFRVFLPSSPE